MLSGTVGIVTVIMVFGRLVCLDLITLFHFDESWIGIPCESVTARLDVMLYREKPTNQLALFCLPAGAASHSFSFDHRRRPETLRTAIATAFFWPTSTTSRFPRVTPV